MVSVYPLGTTIYDPEKCYNGYTLIGLQGNDVQLLSMSGKIVRRWTIKGSQYHHCRLLDNGNLLVQESEWTGDWSGVGSNSLREYNWDGELVWEYRIPERYQSCSMFDRLDNRNTICGGKEYIPEDKKKNIKTPKFSGIEKIYSDVLLEVTSDKELIWEWHAYDHIDTDRYLESDSFNLPGGWNWTHFNSVQALPENRWYDQGDTRFKPGNLLVSPRTLGFIFIVDKGTKEIVWEYSGDYVGGLAGQHEPAMIPKGVPGEGNIIVFDNGVPPIHVIRHAGKTFILEINPSTNKIEWIYEEADYVKFFNPFAGGVERLPNGNTLIDETYGGRVFEVTRDRETVWEFALEKSQCSNVAYRYSPDHCPQLEALGDAVEKKVTPPSYVNTTAELSQDGFDLSSQQHEKR